MFDEMRWKLVKWRLLFVIFLLSRSKEVPKTEGSLRTNNRCSEVDQVLGNAIFGSQVPQYRPTIVFVATQTKFSTSQISREIPQPAPSEPTTTTTQIPFNSSYSPELKRIYFL